MPKNRWLVSLLCGYGGLAACVGTMADPVIQSLASIQSAARAFIVAQHQNRGELPQIELRDLDSRLRLAQCLAPLEAFLPGGAKTVGSTSIGIRCPGPTPWTVYQIATVRVFDQVLVASRFLTRGTVLGATDFRLERRDLSALAGGYETAPERLMGKQLRYALNAGTAIPPQALRIVPAIRRGETVTLVSRQGGMEVLSSGIALSDAELGGRVQVRNISSKRVVEGTVIAKRQVEVGR